MTSRSLLAAGWLAGVACGVLLGFAWPDKETSPQASIEPPPRVAFKPMPGPRLAAPLPLHRHAVELELHASNGKRVDAARVLVCAGDTERWFDWTHDDPMVGSASPQFTVHAYAALRIVPGVTGHRTAALASSPTPIDATLLETSEVRVVLRPTATVVGTVHRSVTSKQHAIEFEVCAVPVDGVAPRASDRIPSHARRSWTTAGAFAFPHLRPGYYAVGFVQDGNRLTSPFTLQVGEGLHNVRLDDDGTVVGPVLAVRATNATGTKVHDVSYRLVTRDATGHLSQRTVPLVTNGSGSTLIQTSRLPKDTPIWLRATSPTSGIMTTELESLAPRTLELTFPRPVALEVALGPRSLDPDADYQVRVLSGAGGLSSQTVALADWGGALRRPYRVAPDGSVRFGGLRPETVTVQLERVGQSARRATTVLARRDVDLLAGNGRVRL